MKNAHKKAVFRGICTVALIGMILREGAAVEFEKKGNALAKALNTTSVFKKTLGKEDVFYSKDRKGNPERVVFFEKGLYPPDCTHTWAIALDAKTGKVQTIRVLEMSCTHAFPTRENSFLDQFVGKGPADLKHLDATVKTIAKATGSSKLTTDAVKRAVVKWSKFRKELR